MLYSYYCSASKTIFFGEEYFIKSKISNNKVQHSLFVSKLMAKVYKQSNVYLYSTILFGCGFCRNIGVDHSKNNCRVDHSKIIDSNQLFYCPSCLVKFNVQNDFNEHILSSEHIILHYFKPNQIGELKYIEHCMETKKMFSINESDDDEVDIDEIGNDEVDNDEDDIYEVDDEVNNDEIDYDEVDNEYILSSDTNSNDEEICESFNSHDIELQNTQSESHDFSHVAAEENTEVKDKHRNESILNCMRKLSAHTPKSALNNYLRIKFELLKEIPQAINVFIDSKSFFCAICDSVFCDQCDWTKHNTEFHDGINNLSVFFCAICHIYHISNSISVNDHLQSIEHTVMLEFQEYMINNTKKPVTNSQISSTPLANIQVTKKKNKNKNCQNSRTNKNIYIEITGVNSYLKANNYSTLSKLIKEKYGEFKQISNKNKSFIILFNNMKQVDDFVNTKYKLESHYGFNIKVLRADIELSLKTEELFSDGKTLCDAVNIELQTMMPNKNTKTKIKKLCNSIRSLHIGSDSIDVHVFGSRIYELATEYSDVDLYLDIGGTFDGDIANDIDRQVDLVKTFATQCYLKCDEFINVEEVCDARVPIVKFYHVPTKMNCDVSFKSGLSLYNSNLIKLYLSMNSSVKWLVCVVVKLWAMQNNLKDKTLFTSYALVWLVLFYLMVKKIVPPLSRLVQNATVDDQKIIEGWDCTFGTWSGVINIPDYHKLLMGFFQFYANKKKLQKKVLCTFTGKCIKKYNFFQHLCDLSALSEIQREKFKTFKSKVHMSFVKHNGLAIHDPFELSFNLTRNINNENLTDFCELCDQSVTLLRKIKDFKM